MVLTVFLILASGTEGGILTVNHNPVEVSKLECGVSCIHASFFSFRAFPKRHSNFQSVGIYIYHYISIYVIHEPEWM